MKVLVACEYSGIVRDAFLKQGHDAVSCDILPTESPGPHYQGDVREILDDGWDLIIAHPPCTYLSRAGARWMYPGGELNQERYQQGLEAKEFFMLFFGKAPKVAVENPTPLTVFELPEPTQVVQPYEYGHPFSKRTLLWLENLPPLEPTNIVDTFEPYLPSNTGHGRRKGQKSSKGHTSNSKEASRFWPGIAEAMAKQWT